MIVAVVRLPAWVLGAALALHGQSAGELYVRARQAEKNGEYAKAYLYYAQAAALAPGEREYWSLAQSIQTKALTESPPVGKPASAPEPDEGGALPADAITEAELQEARRPLPPARLEASLDRKSFDLKGDAKEIFLEVARAYGLDAVFDGDYQPAASLRFRVEDVDYRSALRALEAATGSFIVPLGPRLFLVVKDTPQKRTEAEPAVALLVSIPEPVSIQEAQEMARSVQQAMEIQRLAIDSARRLVLVKDRVTKARPAQAMLEQLLRHRPQVVVEVELLDLDRKSSLSFGLDLPSQSALAGFGPFRNLKTAVPSGFSKFLAFGGGASLVGLAVADAQWLANLTTSTADTLLRATLRSLDGQAASLHVGDRYPVITQGYYGPIQGAGQIYTPPPTFNFEDLGLVLKVTPKIHGDGEVSLDVESEFKVLTGKALNGIPVIANRKLISKVRLKDGEWAVVAGLVSSSEARSLGSIAGLGGVPLLGPLVSRHGRDKNGSTTLLVIKPRVINGPASDEPAPAFWVGSESRLPTPM